MSVRAAVLALGVSAALVAAPAAAQTVAAQRQKDLDAFAAAKPEPGLARMSATDRLLAIEDVKTVILRYARCTSQKDVECFRALISPDLEVTHPSLSGTVLRGGDGMVQLLRDVGTFSDRMITIIHPFGAEVELLSSSRARARWAAEMISYAPPRAGPPGKDLVGPGQELRNETVFYQTFEKVGGAWKIRTNMHLDLLREAKRDDITLPIQETPPN
jgi:hypothetical protein